MLDAADIILITVGCVLLVLTAIAAVCAALYCKRKTKEEKALAEERRRKMALQFYVEQPVKFARDKGGARDLSPHSKAAYCNAALEATIDETINDDTAILKDTILDYRPSLDKKLIRPEILKISSPDIPSVLPAEAVYTEHLLSEFPDVMRKIRASGAKVIQEEFKILEKRSRTKHFSCIIAERNKKKNRFTDILPYDESRVVLEGDRYINASFVNGHHNAGQFIATQGPIGPGDTGPSGKESTVDDFWSMVWEKNVSCIVMLTDCDANLQSNCSQYWPSEVGSTQKYGDIMVRSSIVSPDGMHVRRTFSLTKEHFQRQVTQFHYYGWQDSSAALPDQLLDFMQPIMHQNFNKPIVVHCSAGVGRTGVFIAVWRALERARQEGVIDVFSLVDKMRSQRRRMVQTVEQYANIYDAIWTAVQQNRL